MIIRWLWISVLMLTNTHYRMQKICSRFYLGVKCLLPARDITSATRKDPVLARFHITWMTFSSCRSCDTAILFTKAWTFSWPSLKYTVFAFGCLASRTSWNMPDEVSGKGFYFCWPGLDSAIGERVSVSHVCAVMKKSLLGHPYTCGSGLSNRGNAYTSISLRRTS